MPNHKGSGGAIEKVLNYLADSILHESDESTFAEAIETGADPQTAEYTRSKLREASLALHRMKMHLSNLGHTFDSGWHYRRGEYQNTCLSCGWMVSFKPGSHESQGVAMQSRCSARDERAKREASHK